MVGAQGTAISYVPKCFIGRPVIKAETLAAIGVGRAPRQVVLALFYGFEVKRAIGLNHDGRSPGNQLEELALRDVCKKALSYYSHGGECRTFWNSGSKPPFNILRSSQRRGCLLPFGRITEPGGKFLVGWDGAWT